MREIRFKAWDKVNGEMIPWNRLLNGHNLRNVFMRPEMCGLILMQFTGLKDKNGVGIYEGDTVRVFDAKQINQLGRDGAYVDAYLDELDEVDFIVFKDGGFVLNRTGLDVSICQSIEEFTVIGNIHENPELPEESK